MSSPIILKFYTFSTENFKEICIPSVIGFEFAGNMPTKKSKPTAFMMFVNQWRDKNAYNLNLNDAIAEAGVLWANMNLDERTPYVQSAIVEKQKLQKKKKSKTNDV